ncbi:MAG: OmpA family protein [Sulfuricurvum sp.]|nr:OmpA family protein [Sulfuricurvum sp.]
MMKNVAFLSATVAMLVLSGCSSKEPAIDATQNVGTAPVAISSDAPAATVTTSNAATNADIVSSNANVVASPQAAVSAPITENASTTVNTATADAANVIAPITETNVSNETPVINSVSVVNGQIVSVYFDFDKYDIREDMIDVLNKNNASLKGKSFKLEGNCDEFGSDEYNFALGLKRANAVKSALVNGGINSDSISMVSLGEGNPTCLDKTQECWAKNRRVDFKLQ